MAQPLQPKIVRDNKHPLLQRRLAASANGWTINPSVFKIGCKGWPRLPCDEAAIRTHKQWRSLYHDGTAVRVVGKLAVYDCDVSIDWVADLILDDLFSIDPDAFNAAVVRDSERVSQALFFRTATPFGHILTHHYTAHPELLPQLEAAYDMKVGNIEDDEDQVNLIRSLHKQLDPQKVETYGPLSKGRHFQYEGTHSPGRQYRCGERAPWNTKVDDLPLLPLTPEALVERAEAILAANLTLIPERVDKGGEVVYDLTPETMFYPKEGMPGTVAELADGLEWDALNGIYGCLPSTRASQSQGNCKLFVTRRGRIAVQNWANNGRIHYMVSDAPPPPFELPQSTIDALREIQPAKPAEPDPVPPRAELSPTATPEEALDFLLMNYAFDYHSGMVARLYGTDIETTFIKLETFHNRYAAYRFPPGGGAHQRPTVPTPVSRVWLTRPQRITVASTRFRPDKAFPLYEDGGQTFKNVWQAPQHRGDADISWLIDSFFPVFIPDKAERDWYLNVTAHRWVNPAIPGPSVVMVAHGAVTATGSDYGTGRSGWFDFMARLWGRQYVRNEDFSVVVGQNRQGDFTSWKAFKRLITIDEAKTAPEQNTMRGGNATYELLKTMVDPSPRWRTFKVKFEKPFEDFDYAPIDIASNHQGAVAVPPGDRRFGVINNGRPLTPDEAKRFYAMIDQPGVMAAFARWCEARDLSSFNPYAPPPMFKAKARMQALSTTEMDSIFTEMAKRFGQMFTKSQARDYVLNRMETRPHSYDTTFDKRFDAAFRDYCTALRDQSDGENLDIKVQRPGQSGTVKRERAHTFDARKVDLLSLLKPHARAAEVAKSENAIKIEAPFKVVEGGADQNAPDSRDDVPKQGRD
jgi:hypothetical protein